MNKKHLAKKALEFTGKALKVATILSLSVVEKSLEENEEYQPTEDEITQGEKLPFTGKYFIPSKKN